MKRGLLLLTIAFFVWTTSAHADVKVVVRSFPGPGGVGVQRAVIKQLKASKGIRLVSEAAAKKVAKRRSVSIEGAAQIEVARQLGVSAWVEGRTRKKGGKIHATIEIINAADNEVVDSWSFVRKKPNQLPAAVKSQFRKEMRGAFRDVSAPERERSMPVEREPEPVAEADEEESEPEELLPAAPAEQPKMPEFEPVAQARDDESVPGVQRGNAEQRIDGDEEEASERSMSGIEARVGVGMLRRTLTYNEPFTQNLGNYALPAGPVADVGLKLFPGGFASDGPASWFGFDLHGQFAFGLASESSDGTQYETAYKAYDANFLVRVPVSRHALHAYAGYAVQSFTMEDRRNFEAPVPDVDYRAVRAGLGARFALGQVFGLGFEAGYLYLLSIGELESDAWFPNATGAGLEGQLFADARVYKGLSARLFVNYQRQFFDFNSQPSDLRVAGGAVDQYLTAGLGLGYVY